MKDKIKEGRRTMFIGELIFNTDLQDGEVYRVLKDLRTLGYITKTTNEWNCYEIYREDIEELIKQAVRLEPALI